MNFKGFGFWINIIVHCIKGFGSGTFFPNKDPPENFVDLNVKLKNLGQGQLTVKGSSNRMLPRFQESISD